MMPMAEPPARHCLAPGLAFSLCGEEEVKASPPCGEESLQEMVSPLARRKWCTREGS
jgi:hypothetical protein